MNPEETQIQNPVVENPEQNPDLPDVEVMSNGEVVDIKEPEANPQSEPESNPQEDPSVQEDFNSAKASMQDAKNTLTEKGINYEALEAEYNEKGELSAESYAALEKAGYAKAVVDAVIAGWQAKADTFFNTVVDNAGGSEEYGKIQQFIVGQGDNAVKAFNSIMEQGDLNTINAYVAGIKAQMVAKYGTSNPTLTGKGMTNSVQGFADQAEMVKAMSDKRYNRDAKYTKEVEARIAASKIFS